MQSSTTAGEHADAGWRYWNPALSDISWYDNKIWLMTEFCEPRPMVGSVPSMGYRFV